ncbi:MAG: DUF4174 domain-containing protein [Rhodobacteraceae bacterium]|nr:DUF4174 domain-containing protein [Paracoccaceae bacterium]
MIHRFKPLTFLFLALTLAGPAPADEVFAPVAATDVVVADHLFVHRPVVVFADSPDDPAFQRQMALLARGAADLAERDVIVVIDTDPSNPTELRHTLRPRGFALILMDKDWKPTLRKPLPWDAREITRAIDKMPLARAEALEQHPSGR